MSGVGEERGGGEGRRTLHCLAVLRTRRELIRAHWFFPYLLCGK